VSILIFSIVVVVIVLFWKTVGNAWGWELGLMDWGVALFSSGSCLIMKEIGACMGLGIGIK
jgi:hypothetical protein